LTKSDIAIVVVLFPCNLVFWEELYTNLSKIDYEFDLIIILDGIDKNLLEIRSKKHKIHYVESSETPFKNRVNGFIHAKELGYSFVIFQDSDDLLTLNRVKILRKKLENYSIVCNDLDLINENSELIKARFWRFRIPNNTIISSEFLKTKNVVGFGNVGMSTDININRIELDINLVAPDWYFFSMLSHKHSILFTNEARTLYRQHSNNTVGLKSIDFNRMLKTIDVKIEHFKIMKLIDNSYDNLLEQELKRKEKLQNSPIDFKTQGFNFSKPKHLFWWEESNLLQ
jgi:hypothetical protein